MDPANVLLYIGWAILGAIGWYRHVYKCNVDGNRFIDYLFLPACMMIGPVALFLGTPTEDPPSPA